MRRLGTVTIIVGLLVALLPAMALAHHPEVAVAAVCEIVRAERSGETDPVEERFGRPRVVSLLSDRFDFGV